MKVILMNENMNLNEYEVVDGHCRNCEWCVCKDYELKGIGGTERWAELFCSRHDHDTKGEEYCSWWEKRL